MDPEHRKILAETREKVCETVALKDVESYLKQHKLFNKYMWQDIESLHDVFEKLPTRGPAAFKTFIKILKDAGFDFEAKLLENEDVPNVTYQFESQPKGACFVVNNYKFSDPKLEYRTGAEKDTPPLVKFFQSINYEVDDYSNLKFLDFNKCLTDFIEKCNRIDIVLIILMSHGSRDEHGEYISDVDGRHIYKDRIVERLNNFKCPNLQGKPKVFFFIACRGSRKDFGVKKSEPPVYSDTAAPTSGQMNLSPTTTDMLKVHSTLPGQVSLRDDLGTWFCRNLLRYLSKYYKNYDIEDIMKMVNLSLTELTSLEHGKQVLHVENIGFKKLYLCGYQC